MLLGLKKPTYDKRITLIYELFNEILEVTCEGSSQGKSKTPDLKWPSSTFGSHFSSLLRKKSTYIWSQSHSKLWNWLQNSEPSWWIFFVNSIKWMSHSTRRNLVQFVQVEKLFQGHLKISFLQKLQKIPMLKIFFYYSVAILRHSVPQYWLW